MARAQMVWDGLREYLDELRALPEDCQGEAAKLIEGSVNASYVTIAQVYEAHRFTGTLRKRLTISPLRIGPLIGGLQLRSGSPIAWLFDNGSQVRHWASGKGTGKMWGKTPPTHIFAKTVGAARRKLAVQFAELLKRHGAVSVKSDE